MLALLFVIVASVLGFKPASNYMLYLFLFNLAIALPTCIINGACYIPELIEELRKGFKGFLSKLISVEALGIFFSLMGFLLLALYKLEFISLNLLLTLNGITALLSGFFTINLFHYIIVRLLAITLSLQLICYIFH